MNLSTVRITHVTLYTIILLLVQWIQGCNYLISYVMRKPLSWLWHGKINRAYYCVAGSDLLLFFVLTNHLVLFFLSAQRGSALGEYPLYKLFPNLTKESDNNACVQLNLRQVLSWCDWYKLCHAKKQLNVCVIIDHIFHMPSHILDPIHQIKAKTFMRLG